MAKLQKKKSLQEKNRRSGSSEEISSEDGEKKNPSVRAVAPAVFQNTKNMTAQTVIEGELNFFQKSAQFLREVQAELRKVTWPNRKQTAGATVVVIVLVFIIAAFLGLVDVTLSKLVQVVLA